MGLPAGWTKPCLPLHVSGRAVRNGRQRGINEDARALGALDDVHGGSLADGESAHNAKRMALLGIAVAVPQARWIGERLMRPYDLKFSRAGDGVRFRTPIPKAISVGDVAPKSAASVHDAEEIVVADSGWPSVAWNIFEGVNVRSKAQSFGVTDTSHTTELWRGRRSLADCNDTPIIRGFIPLGEFLRDTPKPKTAAQGRGSEAQVTPELTRLFERTRPYLVRLAYDHVYIEPFVFHGLGGKAPPNEGCQRAAPKVGEVRPHPCCALPRMFVGRRFLL